MAIFTVINSGGLFGQNLFDTEIGVQYAPATGLKDIDGDSTADLRFVSIIGNFAALDATSGYGVVETSGQTYWQRMMEETIKPDALATDNYYWGTGTGFLGGAVGNSDDNWTKVNFSSGDGWVQWRLGNGSDTIIPLRFVREAPGIDLSAAQAYRAAFGINSVPLAVDFLDTTTALDENTSTAARIKVADISVIDDGLGTNLLTLDGTDDSVFELDGTTLYLKAGTTLDYENQQSYSVTVNAADNTAVGSAPNASKTFTLNVNDLIENVPPTANSDTQSTQQNTPLTIKTTDLLANDSDDGGVSNLRITGVSGASGGTVSLNNNGTPNNYSDDFVVFTPADDFTGNASFNYTLSDSGDLTSSTTVTVKVTAVTGINRPGTNGKDTLSGGVGKDTLSGGNGDDIINGSAGGDILKGDNGNDALNGGAGRDTLSGGNGNDRFVLAVGEGTDTITDFKKGTDLIALSGGLSFGSLSFSGNNILAGSEILATLTGVNTTTLNQSNFTTV